MRAGQRVLAAVLAAAVWIYAAMSIAPQPEVQQAAAPSVLEVAATAAVAVAD